MKLCITATGNTLEATADPSFGRAPWLILVDTDTLAFEAVENSGVNATQGAGIAAAQLIKNKGAEGLLTGRVGPKAEAALKASDIAIFEGLGQTTVREALAEFNNGGYGNRDAAAARTGTGSKTGPGRGRPDGAGKGRGQGMGRGGGGGRCRKTPGQGQRGGM